MEHAFVYSSIRIPRDCKRYGLASIALLWLTKMKIIFLPTFYVIYASEIAGSEKNLQSKVL